MSYDQTTNVNLSVYADCKDWNDAMLRAASQIATYAGGEYKPSPTPTKFFGLLCGSNKTNARDRIPIDPEHSVLKHRGEWFVVSKDCSTLLENGEWTRTCKCFHISKKHAKRLLEDELCELIEKITPFNF